MTDGLSADRIAELAALGIELSARAVVRASRADSSGYSADVEILDGTGKPTGQTLDKVPLDRGWLGRDGAGFFAPPMPDRIVMVTWAAGSATDPVIVSAAEDEPPAPASAVPQGAAAWQDGEGAELRVNADGSWTLRDRDGAEVAVNPAHLWRVASVAESLFPVLDAWLDALIAAATVLDTDTPSGSSGRELSFNGGTIAALTVIKTRLAKVLR